MNTFRFLEKIFMLRPEAKESGEALAECLKNHPETLATVCSYLLEDKDTLQHIKELLK